MLEALTAEMWAFYAEHGYVRLGKLLSDAELAGLQTRIDDIMLGKANIAYDKLLMQREADGMSGQTEQTTGSKGHTLNYRKIQNLELDPLFLAYMTRPLFRSICAGVYGEQTPIACFRAMFMNKPAFHGSVLPYHQDRWTHLDRDPLATVWTALDPATVANGCVTIIPGTHKRLLNPDHPSGFLTERQAELLLAEHAPLPLELAPGEAVLLHNWTIHGSDGNRTAQSRRAFSVCYMDAATTPSNDEPISPIFSDTRVPNSPT
ncbi:phytanoyl-CoA dioxygenase family protein [Paenibacillus cymbidii]|uniref:phytanoyl-CoA dioxygenase family protein n=1 Tax=Paenibacillus cymbidii TaxID=1639034 RepID=UPI0010822C8F|nr:phytanoyl-CoA dioxygenase family protein [Paenibacillus cymbidii]